MNVPGFTAEISLYKTDKHYLAARGSAPAREGVYAAQWDVTADDLRQGPPSFGERQCWLPYWGVSPGGRWGARGCWKYRYIC